MKKTTQIIQMATVFVGSIVGAGLSSGRELNQFFSVYGFKSFFGLILCGLAYIVIGTMIVRLSKRYKVSSYSSFVQLVCPKSIATFTNITLSLFLICSTSIILAGSSALLHQYFGVSRWAALILMLVISTMFLLRNTKGLYEVNIFVVPFLIVMMTLIFGGYAARNEFILHSDYIMQLPTLKEHYLPSTVLYASFNIVSIVGILVPLSLEIEEEDVLIKGIALGTIVLTVISFFIAYLMLLNPQYVAEYDIPILAVAKSLSPFIGFGLMCVVWLEMFSTQISNIYSLTKSMETQFNISYKKGIFIILAIAVPFSFLGFAKLVEVLYPLYGFLSLAFIASCIWFYTKKYNKKGTCK
ncbi:MAG: YkvI family membrane protein [Cellulosilyticaceae bacterium]